MIPRGAVPRRDAAAAGIPRRRLVLAAPDAAGRRRLAAGRRAHADHRLRPGGRKSPLGRSACATAGRPAPCGRWSAGHGSTSAPPRFPAGPEWRASTARRAASCGWAIAAARRPAIRSGIAGGFSCSRSGPPAEQFASPLCLVELHPETGDVLSRQQILETAEREKLPSECQASWAGNRLVVLRGGKRDLRPICKGGSSGSAKKRLLPYGIDPGLHPAALPAGDRIRRPALRRSSREVARSIASPWRQASAAGGAASSACSASSICRTTGSWREPRGDSSP